ncbi:hypothetical protein Ahy_A03g014026 isoform C [Arachis hypogaea]|uniref:Uncharacterized protein n=1 Tax=Arachis hypogaea TaxID=3818 RepID=A0A445DWS6_ARAHY|nr:hypothetical protein Ahy_A03g014026 isoform C [Arachis hypogaea]
MRRLFFSFSLSRSRSQTLPLQPGFPLSSSYVSSIFASFFFHCSETTNRYEVTKLRTPQQIAAAAAASPLKKGSAAAAQQQQTQLASKPVPPAQAGEHSILIDSLMERKKQEDKVKRVQQQEEHFNFVKIIDTYIDGVAAAARKCDVGGKRRVMRSVAVRWTTKAAVAVGHGGVASSSGIPATVATARDGSPGYHGFDNKQKTERVAGSGALGQ